MEYIKNYDLGDNHIVVKDWVGKKPNKMPSFIFPTEDEYYYQIEMKVDSNGLFEELCVKKVGGADGDGAKGTEYYEEMNDWNVEMIIKHVASTCLNNLLKNK